MTLRELNAHLKLVQELREMQEIRSYLLSKAQPGAQRLTGMPHVGGVSDPTGELGAEIAELRTAIDAKQREVNASAAPVAAWIQTIQRYKTRFIFKQRYLNGLYWKEVAFMVGHGQTAGNVSKICYQYLGEEPEADEPR